MNEREAIARLKMIATSDAARGLLDDAALLDGMVITHDSIAEGVHYLASDPPESVGWKLAAVNASDLAANSQAVISKALGALEQTEPKTVLVNASSVTQSTRLLGMLQKGYEEIGKLL